jgi:drug/metabolite transporter (DMT)-like permease
MILFKAYSLLPAQEAQPLNYTWPIVISIFYIIFLKDKLSLFTFGGLLFAFIGVIVIATRGNFNSFQFESRIGVILSISSSIIWASFWIINLKDKRDDIVKLTGAFVYGTLITFIYILCFDSFKIKSPIYLMGSVYIGLFEMSLTFFLWMKALQLSTNKAKTSTLVYLAPFISLIFIAFILGENIRLSSIAGLIMIVGGILFQQLSTVRKV